MANELYPYIQRLIDVANNELNHYGSLHETDPVMLNRIFFYCDSLQEQRPPNISKFAWSALFVSWCLREAGAVKEEFRFSIRHAIFVKWAIRNRVQDVGLFHAHPIDAYKPKHGDLIHWNREDGVVTYDEAAQSDNYPSHSAIVVDFEKKGGKRYAVTIGGNESNRVGQSRVELTAGGFVRQRTKDPFICVIENLKASIQSLVKPAPAAVAAAAAANLPPVGFGATATAFRKHGTFIYSVPRTIADYGSSALAVKAMLRAGMTHAWVRIHGIQAYKPAERQVIAAFVTELKAAGIAVAGWGWCQGADPAAEADLALQETRRYGLHDYIADIEQGVNNAHWTVGEVIGFCERVRAGLPGGFGITTFGLIDWHAPELIQAALPYVDMLAPQVYWFNHPNKKMVKQFKRPDGTAYGADDPAEYVELCLDRWDRLMGATPRDLVLTGAAYWGEGIEQGPAEEKLEEFLASWSRYDRVVGVNWWHLGGGAAMSHRMIEAITAARLDYKLYKPGLSWGPAIASAGG